MNDKTRLQLESIAFLREHIKPGATIYTKVAHVSRSGMYRAIDCYLIENNEPLWLSWHVAKALGMRCDERHGRAVGISGCGMDMGFAIVYDLAHTLYPDGFTCIGPGCPSNDHSNGDRNYEPHHHSSGGYCLNHRWL